MDVLRRACENSKLAGVRFFFAGSPCWHPMLMTRLQSSDNPSNSAQCTSVKSTCWTFLTVLLPLSLPCWGVFPLQYNNSMMLLWFPETFWPLLVFMILQFNMNLFFKPPPCLCLNCLHCVQLDWSLLTCNAWPYKDFNAISLLILWPGSCPSLVSGLWNMDRPCHYLKWIQNSINFRFEP